MKGTTIVVVGGAVLLGTWLLSKKLSPETKEKLKDMLRSRLRKNLKPTFSGSL